MHNRLWAELCRCQIALCLGMGIVLQLLLHASLTLQNAIPVGICSTFRHGHLKIGQPGMKVNGKLRLLLITQADSSETNLKKFLWTWGGIKHQMITAVANSTMYPFTGFPLFHVSFLQSHHFYSLMSLPNNPPALPFGRTQAKTGGNRSGGHTDILQHPNY